MILSRTSAPNAYDRCVEMPSGGHQKTRTITENAWSYGRFPAARYVHPLVEVPLALVAPPVQAWTTFNDDQRRSNPKAHTTSWSTGYTGSALPSDAAPECRSPAPEIEFGRRTGPLQLRRSSVCNFRRLCRLNQDTSLARAADHDHHWQSHSATRPHEQEPARSRRSSQSDNCSRTLATCEINEVLR